MEELLKRIPVSIIALSIAVLTVLISFAVIRGDTSIDIWGIKIDPYQITEQNGFVSSFPVGSVIASYLSPLQMKEKYENEWILADGTDISTNTLFFKITGKTKLPDLRGMFIRGLNVNRNDRNEDPDDQRVVGDYQEDGFKKHKHTFKTAGVYKRSWKGESGSPRNAYVENGDTEMTGGDETRSRNVALYYYIKIN